MPLTEEQRQAIRDEEFFRNEVRKELGHKGPPGFLERCSAFLETKAGFWLLTTVLAGVTATGFTSLQRYIDREEIAQREAAERARRDMETVLKLGPMLTSDKRTQVDIAIVLLQALASDKAVDIRLANQVQAMFQKVVQNTIASGLKADASDEEKAKANAMIELADATPVGQSPLSAAIDNTSLPVRVYLQIGSQDDRSKAEAAREALRNAGLIAPGIELVPAKSAPKQNDLRYCEGKVDRNALERVKSAFAAAAIPVPKVVVLPQTLCGKVRFNHFEVWYARHGG